MGSPGCGGADVLGAGIVLIGAGFHYGSHGGAGTWDLPRAVEGPSATTGGLPRQPGELLVVSDWLPQAARSSEPPEEMRCTGVHLVPVCRSAAAANSLVISAAFWVQ